MFRERGDTKIPNKRSKVLESNARHVSGRECATITGLLHKDSARATGGYDEGYVRAEWA